MVLAFTVVKTFPIALKMDAGKKECVLDTLGKVKFETKILASFKIYLQEKNPVLLKCAVMWVLDHEREMFPGILSSPNEINILGLWLTCYEHAKKSQTQQNLELHWGIQLFVVYKYSVVRDETEFFTMALCMQPSMMAF